MYADVLHGLGCFEEVKDLVKEACAKTLKVLRPRLNELDLRFLLWVLEVFEMEISELMSQEKRADNELFMQKREFLKWKCWRELVKLRVKRRLLNDFKGWDLHTQRLVAASMKRRIRVLLEGGKKHPWYYCWLGDPCLIWNQ
jgi:hypothetical protein